MKTLDQRVVESRSRLVGFQQKCQGNLVQGSLFFSTKDSGTDIHMDKMKFTVDQNIQTNSIKTSR